MKLKPLNGFTVTSNDLYKVNVNKFNNLLESIDTVITNPDKFDQLKFDENINIYNIEEYLNKLKNALFNMSYIDFNSFQKIANILTNCIDLIVKSNSNNIKPHILHEMFYSCEYLYNRLKAFSLAYKKDNETSFRSAKNLLWSLGEYINNELKCKTNDIKNNQISRYTTYDEIKDAFDSNNSIESKMEILLYENDNTLHNIYDIFKILPETIYEVQYNPKLVNTILCRIYDMIILNVSLLRKYNEILDGIYYNEFRQLVNEETKHNIDVIKSMVQIRSESNINKNTDYEYNIIIELGLDDDILYNYSGFSKGQDLIEPKNNIDTDSENNSDISELDESIVSKAQELKTKLKNTQKITARKINNSVQRILDDWREARKNRIEDKIIKSSFDAAHLLKDILIAGGTALIPVYGPALALIYIITTFAIEKHTELKYKTQLLNDLKDELRITQEKIRDADSANNNKAKYKLMRIEAELKRSINKIEYNIDSTRSDTN